MKKLSVLILALIILLNVGVSASQAGYLPTHIEENVTTTEKTRRINVVIDNTNIGTEEFVYSYLIASVIAEDTDFYLYTMCGDLAPIKVEHTKECIDKIMKEYTKNQSNYKETPAYVSAINDLVTDSSYAEKKLVVFFGSIVNIDIVNDFVNVQSNFSNIPALAYSDRSQVYNILNKNNIPYTTSFTEYYITKGYLDEYHYIDVPYSYYSYYKENGTVTIEQGKADANIFIRAESQKDDLLYISGYMAPSTIYEESKSKSTIKGVSLGYNFVNVEKTESPKNVALGLFSIDETLYDVNDTSFVIPVKNAETVKLYYKSEMGRGACSKSTKYQRSQDDSIKNLNAPSEEEQDNTSSDSLMERVKLNLESNALNSKTEEGNSTFKGVMSKIGAILLNILQVILGLLWKLLRIFIFIGIILIIINKNIRKNFVSKVMNSKAGPYIEKIIFKLRTIWAEITKTEPPIQGVKKEDKNFVFISHSSQDRKIPNNRIETVVKELEKRNIKCWISNKNIKPGQNYSGVLARAIENCSIFMVFLSEAAAQSKEVGREMTLANSNGKQVIPVQIEEFDLMGKYNDWQYWLSTSQIKFLYTNGRAGINELADEVEEIYKQYVPDYNLTDSPNEETVKIDDKQAETVVTDEKTK